MISIADVATQMSICKTLAIALPRFYNKTNISAQLSFSYVQNVSSIEISLSFSPHEPTEEELSILFEEISDAEQLLLNEYLVNNATSFENLKQFVFKHKEDMRQIIEKHKNG
jgi:hypothetical protein